MGTFGVVTQILRDPQIKIAEIVGEICHKLFSLIHVGVLVLMHPPLFHGAKTVILGEIFNKIPNWRFTISQVEGCEDSKTLALIVDYRTISTPNLVGMG